MLEPEHALVLDDGSGTAIGYALGALDTRAFEARCEAEWWPPLRERHPTGSGGNDLDELLIAMLHEPHLADDAVLDALPVAPAHRPAPRGAGRGLGPPADGGAPGAPRAPMARRASTSA